MNTMDFKRQFAKVFFLLVLLTGSITGYAQDLKEDMEKMSTYYNDKGYLTIDFSIKIFPNGVSSQSQVQKAQIRKKDDRYCYQLNGVRMILNPASLLMIYDQEKQVLYREITDKQYSDYTKSFVSGKLDSVITRYDSIQYLGKENEVKHYRIYSSKLSIVRTDIYLNAATLAFEKVKYEYNTKVMGQAHKVEIDFEYSQKPFPEELLNESHYLLKTGNALKLRSPLTNYNLILTDYED